MKENVLNISNNLFFKWALGLSILAIALYIWDDPRVAPNGGTWLGYTLGTIGALTIVFLTLFGVRKRSYRSNLGDLKYWLSAHVWLGLALVVIATLHTGFQFGWNVHTLAYVLTMLVVFYGIWGVYMYLRFPSLMSELLNSKTLIQQGEALIEIDQGALKLLDSVEAGAFKNKALQLLKSAATEPISRGFWANLKSDYPNSASEIALTQFESMFLQGEQSARQLSQLMAKRVGQLKRIREFVQLKSLAGVWLIFHVPMSIGLIASLVAHIFSVFFYW